jgi:hypothetical protein
MKKTSIILLLTILASSLLISAAPTKLMRLTLVNKSDFAVYIRLRGSPVTNAFYYLTVPAGSRDQPFTKVFTILNDRYRRTTWQCNGLRNSGLLLIDGNTLLTFLPCGEFVCSRSSHSHQFLGCNDTRVTIYQSHRTAGEPRMEKVTYFKYISIHSGDLAAMKAPNYYVFWNFECFEWWWDIYTYKLPVGCAFRYQY